MPENENALCLEVLLSLDDVFNVVLAVVLNLSPHVVHHKGLSEVILVVGVGHSLEVHGHSGARLNITDFVVSDSGVHVRVKELGNVGSVLGEIGVGKTGLPLLVVVDHVVGAWGEKTADFLILENGVQEPDLINVWLSTLISDSSVQSDGAANKVNFPDRCLREHHEGKTDPGGEASGPGIVAAVETGSNLIDIVGSTEAPLQVVVSKDVIAVLELGRVTVGLVGLILGSVNYSPVMEVQVIVTLGRLVAQVVVAGVGVLAEVTDRLAGEQSLQFKGQNIVSF